MAESRWLNQNYWIKLLGLNLLKSNSQITFYSLSPTILNSELIISELIIISTRTLKYSTNCYIEVRFSDLLTAMDNSSSEEKQPSYVKLAMRNMVQKRLTSLKHFALTTIGLLTVLVGLAYLTR